MVRVADRCAVLLALLLVPCALVGQSILKRTVQVYATRLRLSEALSLIAREGDFKLSYNAAVVNGDSLVTVAVDGTVESALHTLVGQRFELKETGNHIILLDKSGARKKFSISGSVFDAGSGGPVAYASVHEVDGKNITSTDALGTFRLDVSGERDRTAVLVMRKEYHDTVVYVGREGKFDRLGLQKRSVVERVDPICLHERCGVEDLGVARLLVPSSQLDRAESLDIEERRKWQVALIPNVSTNGDIAGAVVNNVSLNVLAGYSRGLEGFEVGGVANIESRDVKGLQIAGLTNLVGRNTNGVQIAGAVNHTMRTLEGVQIAGLGNTVWDTLAGVQIAGGANVVKGGLRGTQIAGACNVATQDVDGIQIAGGVNVTPMDVRKTQIAGGVNYARNVSGAQIACGMNVARDSVGGGQVGFGANYARYVSGGQVSFGANVVPNAVTGGQVGFGLNYAGSLAGGQFTFGLNVMSGKAEGGQVGTVNFARLCEGGQFGIVNLSDTITGVPIGLLSISLKGYHQMDVSATEVLPMTFTIRTGVRGFHNMLFWSPGLGADGAWGFGYGFGSAPRLGKRSSLEIEVSGEQVVEQREWVNAVNIVGRFGVRYAYTFADRVSIFAGPSLNTLASDWTDSEGVYLSSIPPTSTLFDQVRGDVRFQSWIGYRAGVGLGF